MFFPRKNLHLWFRKIGFRIIGTYPSDVGSRDVFTAWMSPVAMPGLHLELWRSSHFLREVWVVLTLWSTCPYMENIWTYHHFRWVIIDINKRTQWAMFNGFILGYQRLIPTHGWQCWSRWAYEPATICRALHQDSAYRFQRCSDQDVLGISGVSFWLEPTCWPVAGKWLGAALRQEYGVSLFVFLINNYGTKYWVK